MRWTLTRLHTIRDDTRCYFNVRSKADLGLSQLNLAHASSDCWISTVVESSECDFCRRRGFWRHCQVAMIQTDRSLVCSTWRPNFTSIRRSTVQYTGLLQSVADPEDRARGGVEGLGAVPPAGVQGRAPTGVPPSWSISEFCVMVKVLSWMPKFKNRCIMYNLMSFELRTRNQPSLEECLSDVSLIPVTI